MEPQGTHPPAPADAGLSPAPVKPEPWAAVIAYEDPATYRRALDLWERVAQLFGADRVRSVAWSFADWKDPRVLETAVKSAADSPVIIVSLHATKCVPAALRSWTDGWLRLRGHREGTLIAAIEWAAGTHCDEARRYFQTVARQGGLEFVVQEHTSPPSTHSNTDARPDAALPAPSQTPSTP